MRLVLAVPAMDKDWNGMGANPGDCPSHGVWGSIWAIALAALKRIAKEVDYNP